MKITNIYRFIGKVLPDGHLSIPDEVAKSSVKEFEVTMAPVNHVKVTIVQYLENSIEKKGKLADISLDSDAIEKAVKIAFGTANIDDIIESVRK